MPHRYIVSGPDLPAAPSPISQAVVAGNHCYVSGQLAVDSSGEFRAGSAREEAVIALFEVERGTSREAMAGMIRAGMIAVADTHGLRLKDLVLLAPGSIPRTTSGKVRRTASRARYLAGSLEILLSHRTRLHAACGAGASAG